ncbi:amidohydrolase [Acidianus sulfidivorans JP7]|uniref:Amidohydrolase n=1 Tax=Acidianus sulfidivorans JP7 TaxID=619593 RepID=A0A2U9IKJ6_9CREN|nr:nitrilase-related carbon-nitrogen hydrolase [Acidianus sulfidivorans]AWR96506.1 amidohydrolase [Acidianus sulfidivorans JP7]
MDIELAQINPKLGDVDYNLKKHMEIIETSMADCVIFPELSLTGYLLRDMVYEIHQKSEKAIQKIAEISKCSIVGTVKEYRYGILRNSAAVIIDGKIDYVYKFFLPTYGLFEEKRYFQPGDPLKDVKTFKYKDFTFGVVICEDAWHPEPIQALALKGADAVFIPSSSPMRKLQSNLAIEDNWKSLLKAHSLMNGIWSVFVNSVGSQEEEYFWGGSMVVSPYGTITVQGKKFEEELIKAKIDIDDVRKSRYFSSFRDFNRDFHRMLSNL